MSRPPHVDSPSAPSRAGSRSGSNAGSWAGGHQRGEAPAVRAPAVRAPAPVLRTFALLGALLAGLGTQGCASGEPAPAEVVSEAAVTARGELTVVVWFESVGAVPARGTVTSLTSLESQPFDTRETPRQGVTLSLEAGRYAVAVEGRYLDTGALRPVKGERVLYLEPSARQAVRVVVSDQDEDIGSVHRSPDSTAPRLPTSASSVPRGASSTSRNPLS